MVDLKLLLKKLRDNFSENADPQKAQKQQIYMKSKMPYLGISLPEVKNISKKIFKNFVPSSNDDYKNVIRYLFDNSKYREEWYSSLFYAQLFNFFIIEENIDLYIYIIRKGQWWDIVDETAANLLGIALLGNKKFNKYLETFIKDENMWIRRAAIISQLRYKDKTDFKLLSNLILKVVHEKNFFIRKAIGWALRQYSYIDSKKVQKFISYNQDKLSPLSIREGLKVINRNK